MDFQLPQTLLGWLGLAAIIIPIAITAMGFRPAVAFLKNHVNDQLFGVLRKWAYTYVAALAQDPTLKGLASEAKKQQAVIWLVYKAKELGITLTEQGPPGYPGACRRGGRAGSGGTTGTARSTGHPG